jgi:hypothetical protein
VRLSVSAALIVVSFPHLLAATEPRPDWPRVYLADGFPQRAVNWALNSAFDWLSGDGCPAVFSEFRDQNGRQIGDQLATFRVNGADYLRLVIFLDGTGSEPCNTSHTVAFTAPRSRVVHICGERFSRSWQHDPRWTTALLIHEVLHTLGLGENPPAIHEITQRVLQLCRPK